MADIETPINRPDLPSPRHPDGGVSKAWLVFAALMVILGVFFIKDMIRTHGPADGDTDRGVAWITDYDTGLQAARDQQKPLLLAFHAEWCGPCKQMKKTTYPDPEVVKAAESFIPVMIDVDRQPNLARKYQVDVIPSYRIVQPDGKVLDGFEGYQEPKEFVHSLQNGLAKAP